MNARPYTAADVAARLGITAEYFRRPDVQARYLAAGMPAPLAPFGQKKFDRASIDAWLGRYHPLAPRCPAANDATAPPPPAADPAWREHLRVVYGGKR